MRYRVLAADYDGTLATDGALAPRARAVLGRWRASGRGAVDVVTTAEQGTGVAELIEGLLAENRS